MEKIRTTFMPHEELEVSDAEAAELRAFGVVLDSTQATTDEGLRKAAEKQVAGSAPVAASAPRKAAARKRAPKKAAAPAAPAPQTDDAPTGAPPAADDSAVDSRTDDQPEG